MPSITTQGIVLRYANYRDHDRMLTILSPNYGRLDVLSRGCRRPKSALMPASELFVHGEFVLYQQNDHATLSSCTLTDTFYPLRLDPYRLTCASYLTALCAAAVQPGADPGHLSDRSAFAKKVENTPSEPSAHQRGADRGCAAGHRLFGGAIPAGYEDLQLAHYPGNGKSGGAAV